MAGKKQKNDDLYAVLGLKKECSEAELKNAYKKLALRWHPDRCSASGDSKFVEEAKKKFQTIQQAYSVLSDANKRLLYDVGVYDSDDDDDDGMGDFLTEMVAMMDQTTPNKEENKRAKAKNRGGTTCRLWHREDDNEGEIGIIVDQIFQRKWC
ncbi:dnaJ-like protein subfamily B member 6-like [Cucumis melo var. makuwa]|uniref:DnaJ-like protein subfamily B member 6-like n=1 Tax=Cucumis melo var. makuwa TaxID=1194695 RepID=A0A5A7UTZ2_CUCMM|nr:dnaJ-like protein subfamily B member 6-like [Cucumis melo var. makuwa]